MLILLCDFTTPIKDKFLLLASVNNGLLFFVINSEINDFKKRSPDLLESQIELKKETHSFLPHDSWIDCSKVIRAFEAAEVISQINSKLGKLKGSLANAERKKVRTVVNDSRTLERRFKDAVLHELTDC
ncbi:MAG: hypothetical protein ABL983_00370 [Nitrospira sp.]